VAELYLRLLEQPWFGPQMAEVLTIIAEPDNHPVVFRCTQGKDRTGIMSAVLLSILGVSEETIIEDYALTNQYMYNLIERIKADPQRAERASQMPPHIYEAAPESINAVLTKLQEYGSARGYIKANGGDDALISQLENAILE